MCIHRKKTDVKRLSHKPFRIWLISPPPPFNTCFQVYNFTFSFRLFEILQVWSEHYHTCLLSLLNWLVKRLMMMRRRRRTSNVKRLMIMVMMMMLSIVHIINLRISATRQIIYRFLAFIMLNLPLTKFTDIHISKGVAHEIISCHCSYV